MHSRCGDLNIIHSFPSNSNEAKNIVWLSKHWKRVHLNNIGLWFRSVNYDLKWVGCHYGHAQVEEINSGRLLPIFIQQKKKKNIYIYIYWYDLYFFIMRTKIGIINSHHCNNQIIKILILNVENWICNQNEKFIQCENIDKLGILDQCT